MKNFNICRLRIWATIAVIILHTCGTLLTNNDLFFLDDWKKLLLEIIVSLCKWSVPVFLMITGYLLLDNDKTITLHDVMNKYIRRIIWALFLFGIPFGILMNLFQTHKVKLPLALLNVFWEKAFLICGIYIC